MIRGALVLFGFSVFWIPHINYDGIMIIYHISTCSSAKCGLTISIKRPSVEGQFFWWDSGIQMMGVSVRLVGAHHYAHKPLPQARMHAPGEDCWAVLPTAGLHTGPLQFNHFIPREYLPPETCFLQLWRNAEWQFSLFINSTDHTESKTKFKDNINSFILFLKLDKPILLE